MEGTISESRRQVVRMGRRYLRVSSWLALVVVVFALVAAGLYGAGRLDASTGGYLLLFPLFVLAVVKPAWVAIALVALPAGIADSASITGLIIVLVFALVVHVCRQGALSLGLASGLLPLVVLLVLAHAFKADVPGTAAIARDGFLKSLGFYVVAGVLSFNLAKSGELTVQQFVPALLIGAGGTAFALLGIGGPSALVQRASIDSGLGVELQSAFAYISAMAFVVSLAWVLSDSDEQASSGSPIRWGIVVFFAVMTFVSYTRGAWLAALIGLFYIPRRSGKGRFVWLAPLLLVGILLLPFGRDRLFSDIGEGGVGQAIATGQIGTGRLGLWQVMWDEARTETIVGHGFGFTFSQGSIEWFGFEGNFGTGAFVYPHNDLLFWMLELGVIGCGLYVAFWLTLWAKYRDLVTNVVPGVRRDALLLSGVFTSMLVATLTANGIFVFPVASRFFMASGILFALATPQNSDGRT